MQFVIRRPKLPCIAFAGDRAYAAFKYAHFDKISWASGGTDYEIYDAEGINFEYFCDLDCIGPGFPMWAAKKKQLVERVFGCANMIDADATLKERNLNNIRFHELVKGLAALITVQGLREAAPKGSGRATEGLRALERA